MNAQDNELPIEPRDANLLASMDRVLTQPESVPAGHPDTFERFCADLAAAAPQANPDFKERLYGRLTSAIDQRRERAGGLERVRSLVSFRRSRQPRPAARWRLTSLVLALLVAVGGIGAYLHGQSPTPVGAQTVLHRAQAVTPGPNEAIHATYSLSAGGGLTGTAEVWVASTADGSPSELALTQTMFRNGQPAPDLSSRLVQTDQAFQVYDPATNTVTESAPDHPSKRGFESSSPGTPAQNLEGILVGTRVAQKLSRALQAGIQPNSFKLQQQTLDGVSVYALKLDQLAGQTYYFNIQSYALEGADWTQNGVSWQARLGAAGYQTMALSAVPAHTFTLNAPSTAHVVVLSAPAGNSKSRGVDENITALAAMCGTTPQTFAAAVQAGDKSMLAICQETAPNMTADRLVGTLLAKFKATLDAQVTSGAITPAEETSDLANIRMKLTHMIADQPGSGSGNKKP